MKIHQALAHLGKLFLGVRVSGLPPLTIRSVGTHQRQSKGAGIHLGVLSDVPIRHPGTHDTKRKQPIGNPNDREDVRVGVFVPVDSVTEGLG